MSNNKIIPLEYRSQRVITTDILAYEFGASNKNIQDNFLNNKDRFIEGKHYFKLSGQALREFKDSLPDNIGEPLKYAPSLILWTERGAARHAKILDTDSAWEIYEELEETYFRVKEDPYQGLSKEIKAVFLLDKRTQEIESKVDNLEANMPLFNVDCKELQALVKRIGTKALGGYKSHAYENRSVRTKVYSDIQHQLKREFGVERYEAIKRCDLPIARKIVEEYKAPMVLNNEIQAINQQFRIN